MMTTKEILNLLENGPVMFHKSEADRIEVGKFTGLKKYEVIRWERDQDGVETESSIRLYNDTHAYNFIGILISAGYIPLIDGYVGEKT